MRLPERLPPRLPAILFGILAILTVGAFYLTQHLKVLDPLVNGGPRADPPVIDPRFAGVCPNDVGTPVSHRVTRLGFYLQNQADTVIVRVLNAGGVPVATMAGSGRRLPRGDPHHYQFFSWNGRLADGTPAPAGSYTFLVALLREDRTFPLIGPSVQVLESRPRPRVGAISITSALTGTAAAGTGTAAAGTGTAAAGIGTAAAGTGTAATTTRASGAAAVTPPTPDAYLTPGRQVATASLALGSALDASLLVLRVTAGGPPRLLARFPISPGARRASWNGRLPGGAPAPAGPYALGVSVTDPSCTTGTFPAGRGTGSGVGVDVTYLSAAPPPVPVPAGTLATVRVLSGGAPVTWQLRRGTAARVIFHGADPTGGPVAVRLPGVGLYSLTLHSGAHTTAVPLVAAAVGARAAAPVLVVLPALSWQGANATGDGHARIDRLDARTTVPLARPLVRGLPSDYADEAALLDALDARHLPYDLTTDVGLGTNVGPRLGSHHGLLLDGTFTWLPASLVGPLNSFAAEGGGVFTAALASLTQVAPLHGQAPATIAGPARTVSADPFGVRRGPVTATGAQLITAQGDGLGLLAETPALRYADVQTLTSPGGHPLTLAGIAAADPALVGFRLGRGIVVEAALPGFGTSLAGQPAAGALLARIWQTVLR